MERALVEREEGRMSSLVRYTVGALAVLHGIVYLNAARGVLPIFAGWRGTSWLLGTAVRGAALERFLVACWGITGALVVAAGLVFAAAPSAYAVWRPLAIAAGALGVLSFFAFWDGQLRTLFAQGAIGLVLSAILLVAALAADRTLFLAPR